MVTIVDDYYPGMVKRVYHINGVYKKDRKRERE